MSTASSFVCIGTFSPTLYLYSLASDATLTAVSTSTAFGINHEAIVIVPNSAESATLVVANNNGASSENPGQSGAEHLSGKAHVHTARISASGGFEPVSKLLVPGAGPIHATMHPSGRVAIANYVGGTVDILGPLEGSRLPIPSSRMWCLPRRPTGLASTDKLGEPNFGGSAHMVTFDSRAGADSFIFGVNAGTPPSIAVIKPASGKVLHTVSMPTRVRRLVLHPTLPVAYIVYEAEGDVATWTWPSADGWNADGTPKLVLKELQRCKMSPDTGLNLPTSFVLTAKGDFGYTATRTSFAHGGTDQKAKVGVFAVDEDGTLKHVEWVDSGGWNTRDCVLSPGDGALLTVDVLGDTLTSFKRDAATGKLKKSSVVSVPRPTGIATWRPTEANM
mmetsp:Transcript_28182/g.82811  ORF Transcript_28182/g.82811 Transcript_28182/m.82811 type:complete len:391 (+) Transcript_28182:55-1227(+)|eukprot:CAMPEP_0206045422 /NCGR_PEP_ID=MMETSP1466-20131121/15837_1 /ASSEMBLY_ACC=CAM_ASM_001126 /TAXON_ID=44452 /ORGANISM="Pavlova gyrans, Strain CCMP608" /LENGTH=390 /DNA_ID=CAMNT_0053420357 /DNA_START=30 /DNA_END=1202 /DNA_ORIENTATION=+